MPPRPCSRRPSSGRTATAASSARRAGSPGSSRSAMPRRRSARSRRSTPASMPSHSSRCSTRSRPSAPTTRRASITCPISSPSTGASAGSSPRYTIPHAVEIRGINSRTELAEVSHMVRQQKNEELMAAGVTLIDPATTYVDTDVEVGADTVIHPCVFLERGTRIGAGLRDSLGHPDRQLDHRRSRRHSQPLGDHRRDGRHGARVGPFAHLRPGAASARTRTSATSSSSRTRRSARAARPTTSRTSATRPLAPSVNVGAGTITCNYDGAAKHQTVIEDGAFVGSNSTLWRR